MHHHRVIMQNIQEVLLIEESPLTFKIGTQTSMTYPAGEVGAPTEEIAQAEASSEVQTELTLEEKEVAPSLVKTRSEDLGAVAPKEPLTIKVVGNDSQVGGRLSMFGKEWQGESRFLRKLVNFGLVWKFKVCPPKRVVHRSVA